MFPDLNACCAVGFPRAAVACGRGFLNSPIPHYKVRASILVLHVLLPMFVCNGCVVTLQGARALWDWGSRKLEQVLSGVWRDAKQQATITGQHGTIELMQRWRLLRN